MYTTRIIEEIITGVLKPFDITIQQYNVLRILRGQKGKPANLSTIQERMIDRSSNTSRLVDKLIKKEWVERHVCEQNRRKVEIFITKKGLEILQELDPIINENNNKLVSNLSSGQLEGLNDLLDLLRE
jgi:DNA-binding MarR family transcriptional regulator